MTVRKATIKDLDKLKTLFNDYRVFYKQEPDIDAAEKFLKERFKQKDSFIFVALKNSEIVGFTQLYPLHSSVSMQETYVLNDLYVQIAHRKYGAGEALLNKAKDFCISQNAKGLTLETDINNPAQKLYERLDWKRDNDVLHYTWKNPKN